MSDETGENGPNYAVAAFGISALQYLNAVEWLKWGALAFIKPGTPRGKRVVANATIDLFMIAKFAVMIALWFSRLTSVGMTSLVVYLLLANAYTYFFYHVWVSQPQDSEAEFHRERRRFINLLLSLVFSIVSYGYLYDCPFHSDFTWPASIMPPIAALIFSLGNALTGYAGDLKPVSGAAQILVSSQLLMTFLFIAVLLSNSLPRKSVQAK